MVINECNSVVWLDLNKRVPEDISEVIFRPFPVCLMEIHMKGYIKECSLETDTDALNTIGQISKKRAPTSPLNARISGRSNFKLIIDLIQNQPATNN